MMALTSKRKEDTEYDHHQRDETLVNIYHARKAHKLVEWHTFCDWIGTLPYAKELIIAD